MTAQWCEFRKYCAPNLITFTSREHGGKGAPWALLAGMESVRAKKPVKHCPLCDKRLQLKAVYCCGGNCGVDSFTFPDHVVKTKKAKSPKRKSRVNGRGR